MSEIRGALEEVRTRLNDFIAAGDPRPGGWVILSNIYDQNGDPYEGAKDKLVMMLTNIQRENSISTYTQSVPVEPSGYAQIAPPLYVDLFVMLYANFSDAMYTEGLGAISRAISFFQQNPVFTQKTLPGIAPHIEKLAFEMTNLDVTQINHLVGMLGANYLPSVYYKVRMIPFQGGAMTAAVPAVSQLQNPSDVADAEGAD